MDSGKVLDLKPLIRRKQQRECEHWHVEVDDKLQELRCVDCDGDVDIWWYMRRFAQSPERHLEILEKKREQVALIDKELERQRQTIRVQAERIRELSELQNQLGGHVVEGTERGYLSLATVRAHLCKRCKGKLHVLPAPIP